MHRAPLFLWFFSRKRGLQCFPEACAIISAELMAADSQRRAQCILVKTGSLI